MVQHRIKGKSSPWINNEFINAVNERDYLLKVAATSKDPVDWKNFRQKRNFVNRLKNQLKSSHYRNSIREIRDDPKKLLRKVKELIPDASSNKINDLTLDDGSVISDSKSIANHFNQFFVNVGSKLASKFQRTDTSRIHVHDPVNTFVFKPFTFLEVSKTLNSLDVNKASGTDGVNVRLLKEGEMVLTDKLLFIFNLSITSGIVPGVWKTKRVSPIFKAGNKDDPGNYRPVSVASTPMKIFEKLVYNQMMIFIRENNIIHSNQSGFRSGFSTSSAALDVKEHIIEYLKKNKFVCAVLIDLSKAFETVDHLILLKKLFCYGFQDRSFDWCQSYLLDRKQQVLINDYLSDILEEQPYGVPQGSVLGPLFFLLYINDINSVIKSSYFHLYADDTIIIQAHNSTTTLIENMEEELGHIHDWLILNKLTPNIKKCESIFFTNQLNSKLCDNLKVNFRGDDLQTKQSVKYLGIHFDNKLQWRNQIKAIKSKINYKLAKIRPLAKFLDSVDIFMLIRSFIFPYIHYCSPTWSSAANHLINQIQSTCDKTQLFSHKIPKIDVRQRLNLDLSIIIFKGIHKLSPDYISNQISLTSGIHRYNTRQASSTNIYHVHTPNKLSTQSIKYTAPHLWNSMPNHIKNEQSFLLFKSKCKKYFLT
jgi:hypothetical protein